MNTFDAERLRQRYAELDDTALLKLVENAGLTKNAHDIAILELGSRGINFSSKELGLDTDIEFEQHDATDVDLADMDSLTEVARFNMPIEAHMLEARLHAEGIPAWATNTNTVQALSHLTLALGGVRVMVPSHLWEDACHVIRRMDAGEFALDDDFEQSN